MLAVLVFFSATSLGPQGCPPGKESETVGSVFIPIPLKGNNSEIQAVGPDEFCVDCPINKYQDGDYQYVELALGQECKNCSAGTYQDEEGQSACKTTSTEADDSDDITWGAVIGISVGSSVGITGLAYLIYRFCNTNRHTTSASLQAPSGSLIF